MVYFLLKELLEHFLSLSLFHVKMGEIRLKINASTLLRFLVLLPCCLGHTIALLIEQLVLYNMILFFIYFNGV